MTVSELIEELIEYDPNLDVGIVVSYVEGPCNCGEYCYCSSEDHEHYIESISKEELKGKIKKLWLRAG